MRYGCDKGMHTSVLERIIVYVENIMFSVDFPRVPESLIANDSCSVDKL